MALQPSSGLSCDVWHRHFPMFRHVMRRSLHGLGGACIRIRASSPSALDPEILGGVPPMVRPGSRWASSKMTTRTPGHFRQEFSDDSLNRLRGGAPRVKRLQRTQRCSQQNSAMRFQVARLGRLSGPGATCPTLPPTCSRLIWRARRQENL